MSTAPSKTPKLRSQRWKRGLKAPSIRIGWYEAYLSRKWAAGSMYLHKNEWSNDQSIKFGSGLVWNVKKSGCKNE